MRADDFNKAPDTSTTGEATSSNTYAGGCIHRLPCGVCTLMNRACPLPSNTLNTPYYGFPNTITCQGNPPTSTYGVISGDEAHT